jgi:hypothetical protein
VLEGARLLTAGYSCMLHVHSLATMCSWDKVLLFYATCFGCFTCDRFSSFSSLSLVTVLYFTFFTYSGYSCMLHVHSLAAIL